MRRTCLLALGLALLLPRPSRADWVASVRAGYAYPFGEADGATRIRDLVTGQIVPQLELGYRFKALLVGGYVSYGFGSVSGAMKAACDLAGQSCSSTSLRIGGHLRYAFGQVADAGEPWIGLGLGYEAITVKRPTTTITERGSEWGVLDGGFDWRVGPSTTIGPFASLSVGTYTSIEGGGSSGDIFDRRFHEWLTLGLRGTFTFWRR
jgi:hypothetical protein